MEIYNLTEAKAKLSAIISGLPLEGKLSLSEEKGKTLR